jgi:hypothetical protein
MQNPRCRYLAKIPVACEIPEWPDRKLLSRLNCGTHIIDIPPDSSNVEYHIVPLIIRLPAAYSIFTRRGNIGQELVFGTQK